MIYLLENTDSLGEDFISSAIDGLSLQRLKRLDTLRIESDKINCAAVYLMLRYALKAEYGITEAQDFTFGKNGKPYLKDKNGIFFSMSHCRNACACVVADKETAADIADLRRISDRTAKYFCTDEELRVANESKNKDEELVRLWAMKECYSKLDGSGLHMNYKEIGDKETSDLRIIRGERYYAAFCTDSKEEPVYLTPEKILNYNFSAR